MRNWLEQLIFRPALMRIGKLLGELSELKRLDAIDKIRLMPLSAENRKRLCICANLKDDGIKKWRMWRMSMGIAMEQ
jgi:hypothetical protein